MNKVISLAEAASLVPDGATLALGGMTLYRRPTAWVFALLRRPAPPRDLTLLCFTCSYESDLLVGAGLVKRVRTCYFGFETFGLAPMFTQAGNLGEIDIMEETEASLGFGLRAAIAEVGFQPGRGLVNVDRHLRRMAASAAYFGMSFPSASARAARRGCSPACRRPSSCHCGWPPRRPTPRAPRRPRPAGCV